MPSMGGLAPNFKGDSRFFLVMFGVNSNQLVTDHAYNLLLIITIPHNLTHQPVLN